MISMYHIPGILYDTDNIYMYIPSFLCDIEMLTGISYHIPGIILYVMPGITFCDMIPTPNQRLQQQRMI